MNKRKLKKIEETILQKSVNKYIGYVIEDKHYLPTEYLINIGLDPKEFKDPTTDFFLYGDNYKEIPKEEIIDRDSLILIELTD